MASFALNVIQVQTNAVAAFYSPLSRIWELSLGAALACAMLHKPPFGSAAARNAGALLGILLISLAVILLDAQAKFPGGWALLPTCGALLLIAAGKDAWINRRLLSHQVLVSIGLISFPLYLWHRPLLSFAHIMLASAPSLDVASEQCY